MTAPDRLEQVDAALDHIDLYADPLGLSALLAAEVRALRAELAAHAPRPVEEIEQRLAYLATLAPGWDSYGSEKVDPGAIATARSVLAALMAPVHICGTVNGGIELAWDDEFVTVECNPGDRLSASVGEMYAEPESTPPPADPEDVPARLDATADALAEWMHLSASEAMREVAHELREIATLDVRAAVAAALARPTETTP